MRIVLTSLVLLFVFTACRAQWDTSNSPKIFYNSGNVGIGIASPSYMLDILSSSNDYKQFRIKSPGSPLMKFSGSYNNGDGAEIWQDPSGQFLFNSNSQTNVFSITNNGNVGIGLYNPAYKLVVQGEVHVNRNYPYIQLNSSHWGSGSFIQNGVTSAGAGGGDYLLIYNPAAKAFNFKQGNYDALTISSSGKVGVGKINPSYQLEVSSSSGANLRLESNGSTPAYPSIDIFDNVNGTEFVISPSSGKVDLFTWMNHPLALGTNHTERMRIQENGFVGINTTNPLGRLDINGDGGQLRLSGGTVVAGVWTGGNKLYLADWETGGKGINVDLTSGNVGIGTTIPDAKLAVKGNIHTQEVKVDLTGAVAPDYVFEKDYNLLSLTQLDAYIKQHKHLPEVPSAKQMEEEGLNLKEMNLILLKKVEELTLHMIEQEKRINSLKKGNTRPDCVFESDYKLPSLLEVENFTKANKRLPEVPSAEEVREKNGVAVGEMNALLLQKVEELTLYVIDLRKENEKQSRQMQEQSNEIQTLKSKLK